MAARQERFSQFHKAPLQLRQVLHPLIEVHFKPLFSQKAYRLLKDHLLVDKVLFKAFPQDKKVVHNTESLHQMTLLLDERHLVGLSAAVGVAVYDLPVIPDGSQRDRIVPADQVHHLLLSLPVSRHETKYLPGKHLKLQVI